MNFYIKLQIRRLRRYLVEQKLHPLLALLLVIGLFLGFSKLLFYKSTYAEWIYLGISTFILIKLADAGRNNFLKSIYLRKLYYRIRLIENLGVAIPIISYLLYEKCYLISAILLCFSILILPLNFRRVASFTIPTPFKKFPFEFIRGFRVAFALYLFSYYLCYKAIGVGNFYLGLFALALPFFINMIFLFKPEQSYFVWIYALNSREFLNKKFTTAIICTSIITLPTLTVMLYFFSAHYLLILAVLVLGAIFQISIIVSKYAAFPYEMNFPQAMLYGACLWFPPLFLFVIPYFYKQSKLSLESYLE